MKPTIYITGNDSLPEDLYRAQLQKAENQIRKEVPHAAIINPLKIGIPSSWNHEERLQLRLKTMKMATTVVFLSGWVKGPMAKQEYWYAHEDNKDVFLDNQIQQLSNEYGVVAH
ncbi:DUF4406 domain-containing protein [Sunxiuqinia sp. sy24]|uniref:DUF4406 domain-containing protein n=1 Tax=Sunxiuqinia sp. sy24 TaxID=3461495 RepID=UPI00404583BD